MKFRDPKTGEVFEDIEAVRARACRDHACDDCHLGQFNQGELYGDTCAKFVKEYPAEAARLMGLEVVEKPAMGETQGGKSLFCEHIGVAPSQPFIVHGYPYRSYPPIVYGEDGCVRLYSPDGQKRHKVGGRAITWIVDHPESVEPCEGYTPQKVAFKKEELMEKKDKLRICEVLGVEVGEKFTYPGMIGEFWVTENGHLRSVVDDDDKLMICVPALINHPDRIIRKPPFTEEEVVDAKALMRILGATGIERTEYGGNLCAIIGETAKVVIDQGLFPSLRPGRAVKLEEIIDGSKT